MDKLVRYFVGGAVLTVLGVVAGAAGAAWGLFPFAAILYLLGLISVGIGLVMVVGAIWIDLSQLSREKSRQA